MKEALNGAHWSIMRASNGSWMADLGGRTVMVGEHRETVLGLIDYLVGRFWKPIRDQGNHNIWDLTNWVSKPYHDSKVKELESMLLDEERESSRMAEEIDSLEEEKEALKKKLSNLDLEVGRLQMRIRRLEGQK